MSIIYLQYRRSPIPLADTFNPPVGCPTSFLNRFSNLY